MTLSPIHHAMARAVRQRRRCYWCDALTSKHRRCTLLGPERRRVYECRGGCIPAPRHQQGYG